MICHISPIYITQTMEHHFAIKRGKSCHFTDDMGRPRGHYAGELSQAEQDNKYNPSHRCKLKKKKKSSSQIWRTESCLPEVGGKGVGGMDEEGPKAKRKENRTVCHLRVNRLRDSALTGL